MTESLRILVVGATGGTGKATVAQLLAEGHSVTAFSRSTDRLAAELGGVATVNGDATNASDVDAAVRGHDAVVITLGITENPFRVRLFGTARTPIDVRSAGTRNVITAMQRHGVRRLVVLSSYGVGETRSKLGWLDRLFFALLLKPQIADTEVQEAVVRESSVEWVLAQPVHLTDARTAKATLASSEGDVAGRKISRRDVARFLAGAVRGSDYVGRSIALSSGGAS